MDSIWNSGGEEGTVKLKDCGDWEMLVDKENETQCKDQSLDHPESTYESVHRPTVPAHIGQDGGRDRKIPGSLWTS